MRAYRFHGFTEDGARSLAGALREDGFDAEVLPPGAHELSGWGVTASGETVSEGLLEALAHFFGGSYEGRGMSFG